MQRYPHGSPARGSLASCTRSRLLNAAAQEFARNGFHGTGLRAVAERAGTSLGSVRYHFGGKAQLYRAVLQERLGSLRNVVAVPPRGRDALARTLLALTYALVADPDAGRLFFRAALEYPDAAADEITGLVHDLAATIAGSFDTASPVAANPHLLAAECLCAGAANGLLFAKLGRTQLVDPEILALHLLDLVRT